MGADKCHKPKAEDQASMAGTQRNAKDTKLPKREKKATSIKLESIFETIQRINRLEMPLRHGKRN